MISLSHFLAQHPHGHLLRKRRDRRLGALTASRPNMVAYAAALTHGVVDPLRRAGLDAARALEPHWPPPRAQDEVRAADAKKPPATVPAVIHHEVGRVRYPVVLKTKLAAPLLAHRSVSANLAHVDAKLGAKVKASLGIEIRQSVLRDQSAVAAQIDVVRRENVDLIESISEDYFDRLEDVLADNWENNGDWRGAVEEIEHLGDVTQSRAELIAVDQTNRMNARFNEARQKSLGVTRYEWETVGDDRVRPAHQDLQGTVHDWDDPPTDSDGNTGHPGEIAIRCRCASNPILDLDEPIDDEEPAEAEDDLEFVDG